MSIPEEEKDPGFCLYGARNLLDLLSAVGGEIEGVREAEDIEYVHRMRVATRRIRAALPLFRNCYSKKEYKYWRREIRRITRTLGEARDADVQVDFLQKYLAALSPRIYQPGLECIILRLQQKRKALQPGVVTALDRFVSLGVASEMEDALRRVVVEAQLRHADMRSHTSYEQAFFHISLAIEEVFSYERFVPQKEQIGKHHAMRIAVKRFRYTMESFSGLYDGQMKAHIKAVKHLQDILGEMHDCDVWVDFLPEFLREEKERSVEYFGRGEFFRLIEPGINHLREDRKMRRDALWRSLVDYWEQLKQEGYWDDLRATINNPLQGLSQGDIVRT